jgi:Ca-activated chloride channel family protein
MSIVFREPHYLWLIGVPALLAAACVWRFVLRRRDVRQLAARRVVPARQRFGMAGDLPFWFLLTLASAVLIVAAARPSAPTSTLRRAGIDVVILQDASASMRVRDVAGGGDRWTRSMRFLRRLGDALSWREDRIAMAAFARIAAPQIRLTKDPNTLFFFLDHLEQRAPFRIEDATTWDTNLELGVYWGMRLVEKDEELHGRSPNAALFVLLSDGESWSGEVARSLELATSRGIPVFVIGVGTLAGGRMPVVPALDEGTPPDELPPLVSRLDRPALQRIASAGRGRYFELDRAPDRDIANAIIDAGRRLAPALGSVEEHSDLYWWALAAAGMLAAMGVLFLREPAALSLLLVGAAVSAAWLQGVLF